MSGLRDTIAETIERELKRHTIPPAYPGQVGTFGGMSALELADAVLRVLTEHGDTEQVRDDAQKLRMLADWFDAKDRRDLAHELNVTESEVPDYMLTGSQVEVQQDLRRIAGQAEILLAARDAANELFHQSASDAVEADARADRAEADLAAARQQLDQVRAEFDRYRQAKQPLARAFAAACADLAAARQHTALWEASVYAAVRAEREAHAAKGWTAEHDREHGVDHLTGLSFDYAGRRPVTRENLVKAASLLIAAIDLLDAPARPAGHDDSGQGGK